MDPFEPLDPLSDDKQQEKQPTCRRESSARKNTKKKKKKRGRHLLVVGLVPERLAQDHLGGHPVGRPDEGVPLLVVLLVLGGHAKVGQLDAAVGGEQNVPGLKKKRF